MMYYTFLAQQEQHKREVEEFVSYKNKDLLKTIGGLPAEYRPIFKDMFDELTKQIVEAKLMSFTDGESKIPPQQSCKKGEINANCFSRSFVIQDGCSHLAR